MSVKLFNYEAILTNGNLLLVVDICLGCFFLKLLAEDNSKKNLYRSSVLKIYIRSIKVYR